jgi:hypothetical protein
VIGLITTCTAKEFTLGLMAEDMKEITKWIRNTDMENISGQMVVNMKATGSTESNMDKVIIFLRMELSK